MTLASQGRLTSRALSRLGRAARPPVRRGPADDPTSPVAWARWAPARVAARFLPAVQPPVLVVSLPRSGSSWVGDMLGAAPDAMYLREPLTQGHPALTARVVYDPDAEPALEPHARRIADLAFRGIPAFPPKIVRRPGQWEWEARRRRRVVVKEVNPLACGWFVRRYAPRVVFLVRHPAAVAASAEKQSWLGPEVSDWARRGLDDGRILQTARAALAEYEAATTVAFEDLCHDPVGGFRRLYEFAGLTWTTHVEDLIQEYSGESADRVDAWRTTAAPEKVDALRAGFERSDLPWYRDDSDW